MKYKIKTNQKVMILLFVILFNVSIISAVVPTVKLGTNQISGSEWWYNQTVASSGDYNYNQTTGTYNQYGIWWYNMTIGAVGSYNYNETIATLTITNTNITALNASLTRWLYNQTTATGDYNYNQTLPALTITNTNFTNLNSSLYMWLYNQTYTGGTYNSTYNTWAYNMTTATGNYNYNQSDGSYNVTYSNYAYNQTIGTNNQYGMWWYNQTLPAITVSNVYTDTASINLQTNITNLNTTYNKWWYNMTVDSTGTYNSTYDKWSYNETIAALTVTNTNFTDLNASLYMWLYNQTGNYGYNHTLAVINLSNTYNGNITMSEGTYLFGQPIAGSIGSGIIWANGTNNFAEVNISCSGLTCSYESFKVRLVNTTNVEKYCLIPKGSIALNDNQHNVLYIDNNCGVQKTSIQTYIATPISPGGIADFANIIAYGGNTENVNGLGTENKRMIKLRKLLIQSTGQHLSIINGLSHQDNLFPKFNITTGQYVYLMDVVPTTLKDDVEVTYHTGVGSWTHSDQTGLNLTSCDTGTNYQTCTNINRYRRHFVFIVGYNDSVDSTEIHQLLPLESVSYSTVSACLDTVTNPITYTLPDYYQYGSVMMWAYCGRASDSVWVSTNWIDLRTVKGSSSSGGTSSVNYWTLSGNTLSTLTGTYEVAISSVNVSNNLTVYGRGNFTGNLFVSGINVSNWLYNQSGTYGYNQTIPAIVISNTNFTNLNASLSKWLYNQTIPAITISNVNFTALNASLTRWLYNQSGNYNYNQTIATLTITNTNITSLNASLTRWLYNQTIPSIVISNTNFTNLNASLSKWLYNQTLGGTSIYVTNDSNTNFTNLNVSNRFAVNGSVFYVGSNGKIGIGNTTPNEKLVLGNFVAGEDVAISLQAGNTKNASLKLSDNDPTYGFIIQNEGITPQGLNILRRSGGAPISTFFIDRALGYIGIGTTTPKYLLEINGQTIKSLNISNTFFVNKTSVGIGASNPNAKLQIVGENGAASSNAPVALNVTGGTGGLASASNGYKGGDIFFKSGDGSNGEGAGDGGNGGDIYLTTGKGGDGDGGIQGTGGNIYLTPGANATGGNRGDIIFNSSIIFDGGQYGGGISPEQGKVVWCQDGDDSGDVDTGTKCCQQQGFSTCIRTIYLTDLGAINAATCSDDMAVNPDFWIFQSFCY